MNFRQYLIALRIRINASPELKMKIMWFLDKVPVLKQGLKKIGGAQDDPGIENYEALSPYAKEIHNRINHKIK